MGSGLVVPRHVSRYRSQQAFHVIAAIAISHFGKPSNRHADVAVNIHDREGGWLEARRWAAANYNSQTLRDQVER